MLMYRELTDRILGAAIEVHRELGPGLLESVYEECLCYELSTRGISFRRQVELPIRYKRVKLAANLVADLVVQDAVVVELKAIDQIHPVHEAQLLTYLKISGLRVGLLINFNVPVLKDGVIRRAL